MGCSTCSPACRSGWRAAASGLRSRSTRATGPRTTNQKRHLLGKAADVTVSGVKNVRLAGMASVLGRGGTGFYPGRNFVHIDTGEERIWVTPPKAG
jgi:uncharacterized protein YcbK (DUF882 family)